MATSSHHLSTIPPSSSKAATCDKPVIKNGKNFSPEPEASESKTWESQVLLPLTIDGIDSAFVGPIISLEVANKIKKIFFLVTLKEGPSLFKTPFSLDTSIPTTGYSEIPQRPTLEVTTVG
ncbi:hypothetical protein S245_033984 [Arachis hypogaea]